MKSRLVRLVQRAVVLLTLSSTVVLGLPVANASAATYYCNKYTGGVTFTVCISDLGSGTVYSEIHVISGSYVSGDLRLFKGSPGSRVKTSCAAKWYPGDTCSYTYRTTSSDYFHASWYSVSGVYYGSPQIYVRP